MNRKIHRILILKVQEYIPPFYFGLTQDGSAIDQTKGTPGHDILALVYKQKTGKVNHVFSFLFFLILTSG